MVLTDPLYLCETIKLYDSEFNWKSIHIRGNLIQELADECAFYHHVYTKVGLF